jgi:hypothetical protein
VIGFGIIAEEIKETNVIVNIFLLAFRFRFVAIRQGIKSPKVNEVATIQNVSGEIRFNRFEPAIFSPFMNKV